MKIIYTFPFITGTTYFFTIYYFTWMFSSINKFYFIICSHFFNIFILFIYSWTFLTFISFTIFILFSIMKSIKTELFWMNAYGKAKTAVDDLAVLHEFFTFGVVQTDPNYGNFLVRDDGDKLVLLDFGAVREYPQKFRNDLHSLLACAIECDRARSRPGDAHDGSHGGGLTHAVST